MRPIAAGVAICLLGGCTSQATSVTTTGLGRAQGDVQNAIGLWGIAQGLAEVAGPALRAAGHPGVAAALAGLIAAADPVIGQAQAQLTSTTSDAAALEALAAQIKAQADALTLTAAPAIMAVPASP